MSVVVPYVREADIGESSLRVPPALALRLLLFYYALYVAVYAMGMPRGACPRTEIEMLFGLCILIYFETAIQPRPERYTW